MATLATDLLDFILDLLRDEDAAADFLAAPRQTLEREGLSDVCLADLDEVQSLLRFVPELAETSAGLAPSAAGTSVASATLPPTVTLAPAVPLTTQVSPVASAEDDLVIERLRDIQQTFTYTANTTIDASNGIWAGRDVYEIFGDDNVMAVGGSVAADGDVDDVDLDHSVDLDIDGSFNPRNSGNTQDGIGNVNGNDADVDVDSSGNSVDGDGNAVGRGNDVDNTDRSVNVDGDGNAVGASARADNSDRSVEVEDSAGVSVGDDNTVGDVADGNGNALGNTTTVSNSGNEDSREYDESFNDISSDDDVTDSYDEDNSDNSTSDDDVTGSYNEDNSDNSTSDDDEFDVTLENSAVDFGRGSAVSNDDGDPVL